MKTLIKLGMHLLIVTIFFSCSEDDEMNNIDNTVDYTVIRFGEQEIIYENNGPHEIIITFDTEAHSSGQIDLKVHIEEEISFQTIPEMVDDIISLEVKEGDTFASFILIPLDDDRVTNYRELIFSLYELSESFRRGNNSGLFISILDDELEGTPYAFKSSYDGVKISSTYYSYNSDKQIIKIVEENYQDWSWINITEFYYDDNSRISKKKTISFYDGDESNYEMEYIYIWENDRVVKTNIVENEVSKGYILYEYANNNIIQKTEYYLLPDNEEYINSLSEYLYDADGNLIEQKSTSDYEGIEWITIVKYENYTEQLNPFPINDIIPGITAQKNLAEIMKYDYGESEYTYTYSYEFDENNKVIKRVSSYETLEYAYH